MVPIARLSSISASKRVSCSIMEIFCMGGGGGGGGGVGQVTVAVVGLVVVGAEVVAAVVGWESEKAKQGNETHTQYIVSLCM